MTKIEILAFWLIAAAFVVVLVLLGHQSPQSAAASVGACLVGLVGLGLWVSH